MSVLIFCAGETVEEQRRKMQLMDIAKPSTNVVVMPSKVTCCCTLKDRFLIKKLIPLKCTAQSENHRGYSMLFS